MSEARQTPLRDLLLGVPADGRAIYDEPAPDGGRSYASRNIPYGRLCREAVAEIDRLRASNAELAAALKAILSIDGHSSITEDEADDITAKARAALNRHKEQTNANT